MAGEIISNPPGDSPNDSAELAAIIESLDEEVQETVLKALNLGAKKDFKDIPSVVKSLKEGDKMGADLGNVRKQLEALTKEEPEADKLPVKPGETEPQAPSVISPVIKNLYFKQNPEIETVWEDVLKVAAELKKDPFEVYEGSAYFQSEAKIKAEAKFKEEKAMGSVSTPGTQPGNGEFPFEEIDLENPEHVKWLKSKEGRLEQYNQHLQNTNFGGFKV